MTQFLKTNEHPEGFKLEDILNILRRDIIARADKITQDDRREAKLVLKNNVAILSLLTEAIELAEDSTSILDKAFGPSDPGNPRIGVN